MRLLTLLALAYQVTSFELRPDVKSLTQQSPLHALKEHCDCHGIDSTTKDDTWYICNNASLGPQFLPWRLPLLSLVSDYDRFGGLTPAEFLAKWRIWNGKKNKWDWNYPKDDGFHLDVCDRPMKSFMTLKAGFKVDRFGGEGGTFLGAADAPFSQRSLPPDALNVCKDDTVPCATTKDHPWQYYVYNVARDFEVIGGPIAPGFGQPGLGIQFYTGRIGNVSQLVDLGLLKRLNLNDISLGPGPSGKCGRKPVNLYNPQAKPAFWRDYACTFPVGVSIEISQKLGACDIYSVINGIYGCWLEGLRDQYGRPEGIGIFMIHQLGWDTWYFQRPSSGENHYY